MKYFFPLRALLLSIESFSQKKIEDVFKYKVTYSQVVLFNKDDSTSTTSEDMYLFIGDETSSFSSEGMAVKQSYKISGNSAYSTGG